MATVYILKAQGQASTLYWPDQAQQQDTQKANEVIEHLKWKDKKYLYDTFKAVGTFAASMLYYQDRFDILWYGPVVSMLFPVTISAFELFVVDRSRQPMSLMKKVGLISVLSMCTFTETFLCVGVAKLAENYFSVNALFIYIPLRLATGSFLNLHMLFLPEPQVRGVNEIKVRPVQA